MPGTAVATVVVGKEKKRFAVHETLLTHYSEFFRATLNGGFKEAEEKCVTLEDEDPIIFESFVYWLYHQKFPTYIQDEHGVCVEAWMGGLQPSLDFFIYLHILNDKYSIKRLGREALDAAFDAIDGVTNELPRPSTIRRTFECFSPESAICRFMIDACAFWGYSCNFNNPDYYNCAPFISGLIYRLIEMRGRRQPDYKFCQPHEHNTEQERNDCKGKRRFWRN